MAYSSSTSITDQSDLMTQVSTFAVSTNGWTQDNYDAGNKKMSLHKGNVYVHFWWDDTSSGGSTYGKSIGMYQSLGYIGSGTAQYAHTDDSQTGANSASDLCEERGIKYIGDGPYTSLHMFGHTDIDVIYCVLEYAPGLYRHFGFGNLDKVGTWTGGEFVYGHHWSPQNGGPYLGDPDGPVHSVGLDGCHWTGVSYHGYSYNAGATLHVEGLPNQTTQNPKWGVVGQADTLASVSSRRVGRDGNDRAPIQGAFRGGIGLSQFGWALVDVSKGYIPICPMEILYYDYLGTNSNNLYYLGRMHNIGHVQMRGMDPQQAITIGADTWRVFPGVRQSKTSSYNEESWNMGIIYKQ